LQRLAQGVLEHWAQCRATRVHVARLRSSITPGRGEQWRERWF
jgi:hypothetical protein